MSLPSLNDLESGQAALSVIGLGYVGLPLAVELGKRYKTVGFDINGKRIAELKAGRDHTREIEAAGLAGAGYLSFTSDAADISRCRVFIITVPTPIDQARRPDLNSLLAASRTVGGVLKPGDVVIYESTVYPGCTEEDCVPVLESVSGLRRAFEGARTPDKACFHVGYSPERINPGDSRHRLPDITKVTSGCTPETADFVDALYGSIITAGTHKAPSIRTAEAAKVIENVQRDVNIALVNELAMLFGQLGLDTAEVLEAAATKWNFLPFRPGLVGGHCIGVDPYYLTHKAQMIGFHPQMILAGRRTNDGMGGFVAGRVLGLMAGRGVYRPGGRVLVLGLTFKANCPDLRNTRVMDLITALSGYSLEIDVHDPWVDSQAALDEHGLELISEPQPEVYDAVVLAVAHREFLERGSSWMRNLTVTDGVIYDVNAMLPPGSVDGRL